jgi:AraC-like DNA-binding protein
MNYLLRRWIKPAIFDKMNKQTVWDSFLHYLPYSEEDERLGMVCTTAGSVEVPPFTEYPPHKNDHPMIFRPVSEGRALPAYHIVYITKGRGIFEARRQKYDVQPGSVLFLMPKMWHRYQPVVETGWHEYWVGFKGSFFSRLVDEQILSEDRVFFDTGLHNRMIEAFHVIFEEVETQKPLYQLRACSGVFALIAEILTQERRKEQPNYYEKIIVKTKQIMEDNIFGSINMPNISDRLGINPSRLNEIFKAYTSMTPYQYFIHMKILKAENLLEAENASIKEVAYNLGFEDQYYFSRLFKNKTGVTPSRWKKGELWKPKPPPVPDSGQHGI